LCKYDCSHEVSSSHCVCDCKRARRLHFVDLLCIRTTSILCFWFSYII
jgi:hypothetical protein